MADALSADIVIIGSGICGSLLAERLVKTGRSVLILEAGPRVTRHQLVLNYRNAPRKGDWMAPYPPSPWAPHPTDPDKGKTVGGSPEQSKGNNNLIQAGPTPYPAEYIRVVGGTTWHWAAHMWRFVPNDFKLKTLYGVGRDWPFTYDERGRARHAVPPAFGAWLLVLRAWRHDDIFQPVLRRCPMAAGSCIHR